MSYPQIFNTTLERKTTVLIVPLDWGLGHASRCIPIISFLVGIGCEVIVGAEGLQKAMLSKEFPKLRFIDLRGYRLKYGNNSWHTRLKIFFQVGKILTEIKREKKWLDQFLETENMDLIISDNRYGLYSKKVRSVFMTHQLSIRSGLGSFADRLIQKWNYHFIERFSACWIPDQIGENNLAGELSHPKIYPGTTAKYIGWLSRFSKFLPNADHPASNSNRNSNDVSLLIVLSGPEPQRSLLEQLMFAELKNYHSPVVLVRGLPGESNSLPLFNQVKIYNHLSAREMYEKAANADIVFSRSGYTTIMDMLMMGKKCVFIATPGQAEQEYLSAYLADKRMCISVKQKHFTLLSSIEQAKRMPALPRLNHYSEFELVIWALIKQIEEDHTVR